MPVDAFEQLRTETRVHQSVADADRLALVDRTPGGAGYHDYLVTAYGFELPVESALAAAPRLGEMLDLRGRLNTPIFAAELLASGFPAANILNIPPCKIAPMRSLGEACGWLYVAWHNRTSHGMLRTVFRRREPALLDWTSLLDAHVPEEHWSELARVVDVVAVQEGVATIVEAAVRAYDAQHYWFQGAAPSGSAVVRVTERATEMLREADKTGRKFKPPESE